MVFRSLRKKEKRLVVELCVALLCIGALSWITVPRFLRAQNINTPENFPDRYFRRQVEKFMGVGEEGAISAGSARIKSGTFEILGYGIDSLKGIEYFRSLEGLICEWNVCSKLDFSANRNLRKLKCHYSLKLNQLILPESASLEQVECSGCRLSTLDVSGLTGLKVLFCSDNKLKALDVTKNPKLEVLWFEKNAVTSLDVSKNPRLRKLWGYRNQLTTVDLSQNPALKELHLGTNRLVELDITNNPCLTVLNVSDNQLSTLDLSYNRELRNFHCFGNPLQTVNASNSPLLADFMVGGKPNTIYVSQNAPLTAFNPSRNAEIVRVKN